MPGSLHVPFVANTRRSQRVVARVRVRVIRRGSDDAAMSEDTHTLVINAHGALITLAMIVHPREVLFIRNLGSGHEQVIRVVRLGEKREAKREVAIEFASPAPRFWNIDFPPADWEALLD